LSRYVVVAALFVLSLITYIDRAAISSAKDAIATELSLGDQAIGAVFSAFALGYALAQIPAGWFADRAGPRLMLTVVVLAWSLLTALTGLVSTLWSLLMVRFLFGVAEAGAFPGSARVFYNWLPASEHGRANGIIFSASRLGAALAFPLMAWLLANWQWRMAFLLLSLPGIAWAAGWMVWFRNEPKAARPQHDMNETGAMGFSRIVRSAPMLLAMTQYFSANFTTFLCLSWMHPYLKDRYALTAGEASLYTMVILLFGATAQWFTGFLVDRLYASKRRKWSRGLPAILGFLISAAGIISLPSAGEVEAAVAFFAVATFGAEMTISPSWAFCIDVGGKKSGSVSGSMNMAGNLGSFVSANAFPFLHRVTGDASGYFIAVALLNIVGALCWTKMVRLVIVRS
jgi:ACS family glucarate transporter-like MFS transporter